MRARVRKSTQAKKLRRVALTKSRVSTLERGTACVLTPPPQAVLNAAQGTMLVAGGFDGAHVLSSAEMFDGRSGAPSASPGRSRV